jgi:hypothetical protein
VKVDVQIVCIKIFDYKMRKREDCMVGRPNDRFVYLRNCGCYLFQDSNIENIIVTKTIQCIGIYGVSKEEKKKQSCKSVQQIQME